MTHYDSTNQRPSRELKAILREMPLDEPQTLAQVEKFEAAALVDPTKRPLRAVLKEGDRRHLLRQQRGADGELTWTHRQSHRDRLKKVLQMA